MNNNIIIRLIDFRFFDEIQDFYYKLFFNKNKGSLIGLTMNSTVY